jgi:hypothetical protein
LWLQEEVDEAEEEVARSDLGAGLAAPARGVLDRGRDI